MSDETIDETETIEADAVADDAAPADEAETTADIADEATPETADDTESEADAAPVGAGLSNEWTGGEAMAGRPEVAAAEFLEGSRRRRRGHRRRRAARRR